MCEQNSVHSEQKSATELAEKLLPTDVQTTAHPVLIMMSGLPGTGKSHLSRIIAERLSAVVVESDRVRKALFPTPDYSADESELVHRVCRIMAGKLLSQGANVIYDATNLVESQRELIYHLADERGAQMVIVQTVAPEEVVKERLDRRKQRLDGQDISDADWRVYQMMRRQLGKGAQFGRNYIVVNTAGDIQKAVAKILRVIRRAEGRRR